MEKIITKWCWLLVSLLLLGMFVYGYKEMYFHQDDLDWFVIAKGNIGEVIRYPIGDHVNYVWRALIKMEWEAFGWYYPAYLGVSLLIHALVIKSLYQITKATTLRRDLGTIVAILFCVNTNWTETILWMSGQTITITALFVLFVMYRVWQDKLSWFWLILCSWTSALAIGMYGAIWFVYPKWRGKIVGVLLLLGAFYYFLSTDGTAIEYGLAWAVSVVMVAGLGFLYSVVGRLLLPFDMFEKWVIAIVVVIGIWIGVKYRDKIKEVWRDPWSQFLSIQLVLYYLIVAVGRAQYGIGIMRAERYAYLGLALFLLLIARTLRNIELKKWHLAGVGIIVVMQSISLFFRANEYRVRPQQLKQLINEMRTEGVDSDKTQDYLPHFVFNDERWRYSDLQKLLK